MGIPWLMGTLHKSLNLIMVTAVVMVVVRWMVAEMEGEFHKVL